MIECFCDCGKAWGDSDRVFINVAPDMLVLTTKVNGRNPINK